MFRRWWIILSIVVAIPFVGMIAHLLFFQGASFSTFFFGKQGPVLQDPPLREIMNDHTHYRAFFQKYLQFTNRMSEQQRRTLRSLRNRLEQDSDAPALNRTLATYYAWLGTIQPYELERIGAAETLEERLDIIKEIKEKQERLQLQPENSVATSSETATDGESEEDFPTEAKLAAHLDAMGPEKRRRFLDYPPGKFWYELIADYNKSKKSNAD